MASSASMPTTAARQGQTERADTLALRMLNTRSKSRVARQMSGSRTSFFG